MNLNNLSRIQDGKPTKSRKRTNVKVGTKDKEKLQDFFQKESGSEEDAVKSEVKRLTDSVNKAKEDLMERESYLSDVSEIITELEKEKKYLTDSNLAYKKQVRNLIKINDSLTQTNETLHSSLEEKKEDLSNLEELFEKDKEEKDISVQNLLNTITELKAQLDNQSLETFDYKFNTETNTFSVSGDELETTFEEVLETVKTTLALFPDKKVSLIIEASKPLNLNKTKDSSASPETINICFTNELESYLSSDTPFEALTEFNGKIDPVLQDLLDRLIKGDGSISEDDYRLISEDLKSYLSLNYLEVPSLALIADSSDVVELLSVSALSTEQIHDIVESIPGTPTRYRITDSVSSDYPTIQLPNGRNLICW